MKLLEGNTVSSYTMKGRGEVRAITITGIHERLLSSKVGADSKCLRLGNLRK